MSGRHCHCVQIANSMARLGARFAGVVGRAGTGDFVAAACNLSRATRMSCHLEVFSDATQRHAQAFPGVLGRDAVGWAGVSPGSRRRPNGLRCHLVGFAKAKVRHAMSLGGVLEPDAPGCAAAVSKIEASVGRGVPGLSEQSHEIVPDTPAGSSAAPTKPVQQSKDGAQLLDSSHLQAAAAPIRRFPVLASGSCCRSECRLRAGQRSRL